MRLLLLPLLVGLFTLVAGCNSLNPAADRRTVSADEPTPIPTAIVAAKPTYVVARGDVLYEQTVNGRVVPLVDAPLSFSISGVVSEVYFDRNSTVQAGDVIAILDTTPLEEELIQAQAALDIAQTRLRTKISQLAIDQRRMELNISLAQLDLDFARAQAGDFPTPQQQYQIDRLTILLSLAQLELEELNTTIDPALRADVEQAELRVAEIEQAVASVQLTAPFNGQIISLNISPGRAVSAYEQIGSVADLGLLEISVNIQPSRMGGMEQGMPVTIAPASQPGEVFSGYIRQLPYPFGSGSRDDEDQFTLIAFDDPDLAASFTVGDRVSVTILIAERDDVLWLPPTAIRDFYGRKFVVVQDGQGNQRRVDVTLGIEGENRVEILEGVQEGEVVVGQ